MILSLQQLNCPANFTGIVNVYKSGGSYRRKLVTSMDVQVPSVSVVTGDDKSSAESKKINNSNATPTRKQVPKPLISQEHTIGIIGCGSAFSTLVFLEKLIWWCSRNEKECVPFVVCSDPEIKRELSSYTILANKRTARTDLSQEGIIEILKRKRTFLEQSGAQCIVMPCHAAQVWHKEVSEGCSVKFFSLADCVARELKEARLKPLEAGSDVRIGVLAKDATLMANIYQMKLQSEGFEVVLPDKPTREHIIIPATEALNKKDVEGARNLLRIAIQALLVKAVSTIILASDELQDLLPLNDPLLKKCIDPMAQLLKRHAYSTDYQLENWGWRNSLQPSFFCDR